MSPAMQSIADTGKRWLEVLGEFQITVPELGTRQRVGIDPGVVASRS
jgi:hypothetical protein